MQTIGNLCLVRYKFLVRLRDDIGNRNDCTSLDACFRESQPNALGASFIIIIKLSAVSVHYSRRKKGLDMRSRDCRTSHYDSAAG